MRWAQLTFVEDDPGNYDPAFWLDYFKRTHCRCRLPQRRRLRRLLPHQNSAALPQQVARRSRSFGELVAGCRKLDMNVIARTDPHAAHQDVYDAHPDWIAVDAKGKKRRHWVRCRISGSPAPSAPTISNS